jgi:hypothetical protein
MVPIEGEVPRTHSELADLVAAQRLRAMAVGWTAAWIVLGAVALGTGGLAILVALASHGAALVLGVVAAAFTAATAVGVRRAGRRSADARDRIEQAWEKAAGDVLAARHGEMTAPELASAMHTDEPHAESLLARLSAHGRARVDVRDDAELAYRVEGEPGAPIDADDAHDPQAATSKARAR